MIDPRDRFFTEGQCYFGPSDDPTTPAFCDIWDWDRLQVVNLRGTAKVFPLDEDLEIQTLANLADHLSPKVYAISVDDDGLLTSASTDPKDDRSLFIAYLPFSMCPSLASCRTVPYSQLKEIDRLGPGVDLSSYKDESGISQKVAFKFNPLQKPMRLQMAWDELHILKSLPPHPNIVPFDRVVLDDGDVVPRVLGFTTKYIPGGTLEDPNMPFQFQWLQQLTQLVDFLNLELGIMHQDIAPRNLLFDPEANRILLFDFDRTAVGKKYLSEGRDDVSAVVFTLYELITNDNHFATIPHWERPIDLVQSITDWIPTRKLDADVSTFRNYLNEWVATRKANEVQDMERYLNAPKRDLFTLPDLPIPPDYSVPFEHGTTANGEKNFMTGVRSRRTAMELGQYCFRWERPLQSRLLKEAKNN